MSAQERATTPNGTLYNLATSDIEPWQFFCVGAHSLWYAPLEAIMVLCLLIREAGPAALVGWGALVVIPVLQSRLGRRFGALRRIASPFTDTRVSLTQQAIAGSRLIKINGWESALYDIITKARGLEIERKHAAWSCKGTNEALYYASSTVIAGITFATRVLTGTELTRRNVFVSLVLL